ncbi:hypothetical protein FQA39_LY15362 [Lamprigera yunnana]|nr:hypothetical protein FQA39_LY15362 [Lamprigera yunnana]
MEHKEHKWNSSEKAKLEILTITETKRKGIGEVIIEGLGILFSGVEMEERAVAGVGMCTKSKLHGKASGLKSDVPGRGSTLSSPLDVPGRDSNLLSSLHVQDRD